MLNAKKSNFGSVEFEIKQVMLSISGKSNFQKKKVGTPDHWKVKPNLFDCKTMKRAPTSSSYQRTYFGQHFFTGESIETNETAKSIFKCRAK